MEGYNKNNEIKMLEKIKAFCESMISLNSAEKRNKKIDVFFEEMKIKGYIDEDFNETAENQYLKLQYIKVEQNGVFDDITITLREDRNEELGEIDEYN